MTTAPQGGGRLSHTGTDPTNPTSTNATGSHHTTGAHQPNGLQRGTRYYRPGSVGHSATVFQYGHWMGRRDVCRRLWRHLDPVGRELAQMIAAEHDDLDAAS